MANKNQDNKQAAKKKCLFEKILDWISLAVFALLIVALIVLRAPWTVPTVLIAILLVNTIVPKPVRKWIWLTIAIIAAAFVVWVFLPDNNEGWRPYTFDEELAAMETKRSIPLEKNAATIYNQLLQSHDPNSFDKNFLSWENLGTYDPNLFRMDVLGRDNKDLILLKFWKSDDYPEVVSWLQDHQLIIDQLIPASKKRECRFPIAGDISTYKLKPPAEFEDVTKFWWSSDKRLIPMKHWSELLIISANNDIAEHRIPLEMCPLSNVATGVVALVEEHPIRRYFDRGILVTVNTDDPKMFGNSLAGEFRLLEETLGFSRDDIRTIIQ